MKALVTGASGFIGSYLVRELLRKKYKVRCLVKETSDIRMLKKLGVELWFGNVTDKKSLRGITKGVDIVFHLAAIGDINAISKKYFSVYRNVNVNGTKNLLEECAKTKIKKFVHFSSTAAMGDVKKNGLIDEKNYCSPKTPYEVSKYKSELVVLDFWRKYKIPIVILRPTMVYGEGAKKEASKIEKSVKLRIVPIIGDGNNLIHMVHVKDVVRAAIAAEEKGRPGGIYIISGESHSWNELVDLIAQKMNIRIFKVHMPIFVSKPFMILIEKISNIFGIVPPFTFERLKGLTEKRMYDISKAKKELGYKPRVKFFDAKCE